MARLRRQPQPGDSTEQGFFRVWFQLHTYDPQCCPHMPTHPYTDSESVRLQHANDSGWLLDREGKPNLVALLSSAHEASLGLAQLHRENVIHGGITPATCFLKAARNQRGFVVKV